jgi:hypothetical protein
MDALTSRKEDNSTNAMDGLERWQCYAGGCGATPRGLRKKKSRNYRHEDFVYSFHALEFSAARKESKEKFPLDAYPHA